jgi:ditrans,polycis-polyprenyl diphosphate synthase
MSDWISGFPGYRQVLVSAKKFFGRLIQTGPVPQHVGIIMDGNRRYAKSHKIELKEGHNLGFESMASILELLFESGVKCATVYAFSIENFKRSSYEVEWLMDLAKSKLQQISSRGDLCEEFGIKIRILGNILMLPIDVRDILKDTEKITENNNRAVLNVCFPYTSRDEITNSIKLTVQQSIDNPTMIIDEETLNNNLFTRDNPPLDLLIRTSGTFRLSDFLLWQCTDPNCAIIFSEKLWPDFTPWDMGKILLNWSFNKYWYGHGNGELTTTKHISNTQNDITDKIETLSGSGSTGYQQFLDHDVESGNDISLKSEENDTLTSEDEEKLVK